MKKIIIYGAGPYAEIFFYDVINYGLDFLNPIAFTVDEKYMLSDNFCGLPVYAFEKIELLYPPQLYDMIVICGYTRMRNRKEMFDKAKYKGYKLINYISSQARIEKEFEMGENNVVLAGAEIGHDGKMGDNNYINQNCYLAHNFILGSHNIFSAGCIIGGFSEIGNLNFFGYSVTSSGFRKVGDECLIGMGSVLTRDVDSFVKVYGNPAHVISRHFETGVIIKEGGQFRYDDKMLTN